MRVRNQRWDGINGVTGFGHVFGTLIRWFGSSLLIGVTAAIIAVQLGLPPEHLGGIGTAGFVTCSFSSIPAIILKDYLAVRASKAKVQRPLV